MRVVARLGADNLLVATGDEDDPRSSRGRMYDIRRDRVSHDALVASHYAMGNGYWSDPDLDAKDERRLLARVRELIEKLDVEEEA